MVTQQSSRAQKALTGRMSGQSGERNGLRADTTNFDSAACWTKCTSGMPGDRRSLRRNRDPGPVLAPDRHIVQDFPRQWTQNCPDGRAAEELQQVPAIESRPRAGGTGAVAGQIRYFHSPSLCVALGVLRKKLLKCRCGLPSCYLWQPRQLAPTLRSAWQRSQSSIFIPSPGAERIREIDCPQILRL